MANYQSSYTGGQIDTAINKINTTTVPIKVSDLTNDSHFVTSASIPTKTSDLVNDSGFIANSAATSFVTNVINSTVFNLIYPVGTYYWSSSSANPGTLFGGTWEQIENKFVLAAGSGYVVNSTGGAATISYTPIGTIGNTTLTTSQIPVHSHTIPELQGTARFVWSTTSPTGSAWSYVVQKVTTAGSWAGTDDKLKTLNGTSDNAGGGTAHSHSWTGTTASLNNMPPYIVAYCWHRTA